MERQAFRRAREFIFTDIDREIALADASQSVEGQEALRRAGVPSGGGNFLAALALLCYTEFGGKLKFASKKRDGSDHASENFNRFFDELGSEYRSFRGGGHNVYDIFRCGLAHEYYVKSNCTISIRAASSEVPGVGLKADGRYYFVVDAYFRDLKRAFVDLERHLYEDEATS